MATTPSYFPFFPTPYAIASPHHTQIHGGYHYPHPAAAYPPPPPGFVPVPANTTPIHHHRPGFVPSPAYMPPPAPAYAPPPPVPYPPPAQAYGPFGYYPAAATPSTAAPLAVAATPHANFSFPSTAENSDLVSHRATAYSMCQGGYLTEVNGAGGESISDETFVRKHTDRSLSMPNAAPDPSFITLQSTTASTPSVGFGITSTPAASGASTGPAVLGSTTTAPLVGNTTTLPATTTSPTTTSSEEAHVPAEASISKNMPCAILDLKRRLDEQQARDRTSFDKLKGELEKLTSMAAQLATFIGKHTTAAIPGSSPLEVTCTAPIAPKVYDTMPTPSSGYDNFSVHSDQSPAVQDGGTNPREQNLDELPQAYGLHNLNCRTVFRAEGTEHSYYALLGDSPLERATPEPLFSKECVGVFASKPGQQPHDKEQQEGDRLLTCSSKALEIDSSGACLNIISDVHDLPLELQQQDDVKACNVPVLKTSDSVVTSSSKLSSALVLRGLRWLWDPGASLPCFNRCKCLPFWVQYKIDVLWKSEIGRATGISWYPGIQHYMAPNGIISALQDNSFIMQRTAYLSESKSTATLILAAPGSQSTCAAKQSSLLSHSGNSRTNHSVTKRFIHSIGAVTPRQIPGQRHLLEPSLPVVMLRNGSKFTNGQLAYMPQHTSSSSAVCVRHTIIVRSGWFPSFDNRAKLQRDPGIDISSYFFCPEMRAVKPFIWLLCQLFSDLQHQLQTSNKISVWGPGIVNLMDLMLGKTATPTLVQISQTPFKLLNFIEQLFHLEHIRSQLMLQCTFWCTTQSAFLHLQYCYFPLYSELVKLLGCYSSKFSSTAVCKSTTTTLCMRVVLCSGKIAQEGRDTAAVYHIFKTQSPIDSLLFVYIWLHKHMIHLVPNDWELFNQHGVPGNYSAQHLLLFSHQYHKTREIGTFFITFLPP